MDFSRVRMELATLRRPSKLAVAEAPQVGDPGRLLSVPVGEGRPAIVLFLRHTGCPFAEATVIAAREAAARQPEIDFVAVSHTSAHSTDAWCSALGGAEHVRVVTDPVRESYAAWGLRASFGLGKDNRAYMFSSDPLGAAKRLRSRGIINRDPAGYRWQRAGSFALDANGIVRWRHLPAHAGELPDLDEAVHAVTGSPSTTS